LNGWANVAITTIFQLSFIVALVVAVSEGWFAAFVVFLAMLAIAVGVIPRFAPLEKKTTADVATFNGRVRWILFIVAITACAFWATSRNSA
jgi:hypothetical protein